MKVSAVGFWLVNIAYWAVVAALSILAAKYLPLPGGWGAPLVMILGFTPSIVCRAVWKDHFRGQRLLRQGQAAEAEKAFSSFRQRYVSDPLVRQIEWISTFRTTRSFMAIIWNNIGVTQIEQAKYAEALISFELALHEDPLYRIARCNAVLAAHASGREERVAHHSAEAAARGCSSEEVRSIIQQFEDRRQKRQGSERNG